MIKLSVIIPVYNEERTVSDVIDRVLSAVLPAGVLREVVVVDDGSVDRTQEILKSYRGHPLVRVFCQENKGKTAALLSGIANAGGDIILIQDADLEYDPSHYSVLLSPILKGGADVVYGSRFLGTIQNMSFMNKTANLISNAALRLLYGVELTDINTCFKLFRRDVLCGIDICSKNFSFETEVTVKLIKRRIKIVEVPVNYAARTQREGKKMSWFFAAEMFWQIFKYRFIS